MAPAYSMTLEKKRALSLCPFVLCAPVDGSLALLSLYVDGMMFLQFDICIVFLVLFPFVNSILYENSHCRFLIVRFENYYAF
jgi:hypothetical protein